MHSVILADISLSSFAIPVAVLVLVIALVMAFMAVASRWIKVGPDEIAVFSGRKYSYVDNAGKPATRGFYVMRGGGRVCWPIVEQHRVLPISAFQVGVEETKVPNKDNVPVTVRGIATCQISMSEEDLAAAVANFLNMEEKEKNEFVQNILRGHIRSIIGNMDINQLLRDRQQLNEQVTNESALDLKKVGILIVNLVITDVHDELGYIESLGKAKVADTKRDADVAVANAQRTTDIQTSNAKREAAEAVASNEAKIALAQKDKDLQIAEFMKLTETQRAVAETAFQIAKTEQDKNLRVLEAQRDQAQKEAQSKTAEAEATRLEKELKATVITQAEADQKAAIIKANAGKQVAEIAAETAAITATGVKNAAIQTGEGQAAQKKLTSEADANATRVTKAAEAEGTKVTLLAKAEGDQANLLAQAKGAEANLLATAKGIEATKLAEASGVDRLLQAEAQGKRLMLLAQAEGTEKLAQAMKELSEQGKLMLVLDRLPALLREGGDAGEKVAKAIFGSVAAGLSHMGNIQITDLGGGNAAKNGLNTAGQLVPDIVTQFFLGLKARGVNLAPLASFLKFDISGLEKLTGGDPAKSPAPAASLEPAAAPAPAAVAPAP